jgi:hypothetical protein
MMMLKRGEAASAADVTAKQAARVKSVRHKVCRGDILDSPKTGERRP